jgi:hypothetical protein
MDQLEINHYPIGARLVCVAVEECREAQVDMITCDFCNNNRQDEVTHDPFQPGNYGRCKDHDMCMVRVREQEGDTLEF